MTPDENWLAIIYNLRGEAMTAEVWTMFKEYCEETGIDAIVPDYTCLTNGAKDVA